MRGCRVATRRLRDKLIAADAVEDRFDDQAIKGLGDAAGFPAGFDLAYVRRALQSAVRDYLADAHRPPSESRTEIHDAIERLARRLERALGTEPCALDKARDAWAGLLPAARAYLEAFAPDWRLPLAESDDLVDPERGPDRVRFLHGLCHRGATWKEGRRRPGGKRSRPRLAPELSAPRARRGHPPNDAEFLLCQRLATIYFGVTGQMPPYTARHGSPGPFARFVLEIFNFLGRDDTLAVDAVALVNRYGRARRAYHEAPVIKDQSMFEDDV